MSNRRADRACIHCGAVAPYGKPTPSGKPMLSITPLLYRASGRERPIRSGVRVNVCEPCFLTAINTAIWNSKLWQGLRDSLTAVYKDPPERVG